MRRNLWTLIITVVLIVAAFSTTLLTNSAPQLGLDLQGGISVRLGPVGKFNSDSLDTAVNIIRQRVDSLGVAEPEVSREGNDIVVDLPGLKDRAQAERIVGRTAELRFRPVLAEFPALPESTTTTSTTTATTAAPTTTVAPTSSTTASGGAGKSRHAQTTDSSVPTTAGPTPTTTAPAPTLMSNEAAKVIIQSCNPQTVGQQIAQLPDTTEDDDVSDQCVLLPLRNGKQPPVIRLLLDKARLTGTDVETAQAGFIAGQGYVVDMKLKGDGTKKFNDLAGESFPKQPPQNQVAITLDGEVLSAPRFNESSFATGQVQISGNFTQADAKDLAQLIKFGALPVRLKQLTSVSISPTLGSDQLRAGILAGAIGVALIMLYVLIFYRILGLVVWLGIGLAGMLTWSVVAYLGETAGLALTLAGVCGLIVSLGVAVDSYVVYFERLKDDVRAGRTIRASVDRGFKQAFSTILAADTVSIIGAGVLYFLAEGGVRGFAFFLGLSALLDLLVSYVFMHPLVSLMARRPWLVRARWIGMGAGLDEPKVKA
jgi:preprotein translocase subunit SecD